MPHSAAELAFLEEAKTFEEKADELELIDMGSMGHTERMIHMQDIADAREAAASKREAASEQRASDIAAHEAAIEAARLEREEAARLAAHQEKVSKMNALGMKTAMINARAGSARKRLQDAKEKRAKELEDMIEDARRKAEGERKLTIKEVMNDPMNKFEGKQMKSTLLGRLDLEYETDLLEFEGTPDRERSLPVMSARPALPSDKLWLLLVRRMEFELYITMSLEKQLQYFSLSLVLAVYCAAALLLNFMFGMSFSPDQMLGWLQSAGVTLATNAFVNEPISICFSVLLMSKLPLIWKKLNEHSDDSDKQLDAAILLQTTFRAKQENKKYMKMVNDKRGAAKSDGRAEKQGTKGV